MRSGATETIGPARAGGLDAGRIVPAALLAKLLTRPDRPQRPRGLDLTGAHITGVLDLRAAELICPVLLEDCQFEKPIILAEASVPAFRMIRCSVPALDGAQLTTRGNLELRKGFTASGEISLDGARIGGDLLLDGAYLRNPGGFALDADGAIVDGNLDCSGGFMVGEVGLIGARVRGHLQLTQAVLANPGGIALNGEQLTVGRNVVAVRAFFLRSEVNLRGAHIGGTLDLHGAVLSNADGIALYADLLTIDHHLLCGKAFTASGRVNLAGAHVGGVLDLRGSALDGTGETALDAAGLTVARDMLCMDGFTARGEVNLAGAHVGGKLNLSGSTLSSPDRSALYGDGLFVGHSMWCLDGFVAEGSVVLSRAHIGGTLSFEGATLINPGKDALDADRLVVDQSLLCVNGFVTQGKVGMRGARIGGQLAFDQAALRNPGDVALDLQEVRAATLLMRKLTERPERVRLVGAQVDALADDPSSWPSQVDLREFIYGSLSERPEISSRQRLDWLRRNLDGYRPQLYEQLSAVYRRAGRDQDARRVAIAKQRARRRTLPAPARAWSFLLDGLVGYGYRTWLAAVWLAGFVVTGWVAFDLAHPTYLIALNPPGKRPSFHAGLYALDLLLPIGDLNYQGAWIAQGWVRVLWLSWILIGWILATAVIAALAGMTKRD